MSRATSGTAGSWSRCSTRVTGQVTGDSFAIELFGGAYAAYTRGGYIEGGNVQVRGSK